MPGKKTHVEWMVSEDRFLRLNYNTPISREEICAALPRHSWSAIRCRATKELGLMRPPRKGEYRPTPTWDRMKALLQSEKLTVSELIDRLNVTQQRVAELINLHREDIYVFDRLPPQHRGGQNTCVYAYGHASDAPCPLSVRKSRSEKRRNPFAAAAGLVSAPKGEPGRVFIHLTDSKDDELEMAA
jgi:hypothetical protein